MNLISCENCGVVLEARRLKFPESAFDSDDELVEQAVWTGERFTTSAPCPVCNERILNPEESEC
jgi:uncharacterized protein with PIN domain